MIKSICSLAIFATLWSGSCLAAKTDAPVTTVPFGDRIDGRIFNYNRTAPDIATAGVIKEGGIQLLVKEGFKSVIDLRTPVEGIREEAAAFKNTGIDYINIPVGKEAPTMDDVERFGNIVKDTNRGPLLVHCASANRVGTLWAMYRVKEGVPLQTALEEGRTVGMKKSRESNVTNFAASLRNAASK